MWEFLDPVKLCHIPWYGKNKTIVWHKSNVLHQFCSFRYYLLLNVLFSCSIYCTIIKRYLLAIVTPSVIEKYQIKPGLWSGSSFLHWQEIPIQTRGLDNNCGALSTTPWKWIHERHDLIHILIRKSIETHVLFVILG